MVPRELVKKFIEQPDKITPHECESLLSSFGYVPHKKAGSELAFHKDGAYPITITRTHGSRYIKQFYIKRIAKQLDLEDYLESS